MKILVNLRARWNNEIHSREMEEEEDETFRMAIAFVSEKKEQMEKEGNPWIILIDGLPPLGGANRSFNFP